MSLIFRLYFISFSLHISNVYNLQLLYLIARQPASLKSIICMYAGMTYGTTIRDLCIRFNPQALGINERKLVQFGVVEGLIRRIQKVDNKIEMVFNNFHIFFLYLLNVLEFSVPSHG